mgnify:CR=1 FL=1
MSKANIKRGKHATVTPNHQALESDIRARLKPRTPLLIGIDGRDHVGKSSTARYLAWALGISCLETDLFTQITPKPEYPDTHQMIISAGLKPVITQCLARSRPIIVEGIVLLKKFELMGLALDYLVYVRQNGSSGDKRLRPWLDEYDKAYSPAAKADHILDIPAPRLRFNITPQA